MTFNQKDGTERWDNNAESWHRLYGEKDPNRCDLLDPIILEVLGDIKNKKVLDAGCGDGYLSRKLAKLGAKVTGVEISQKMLDYALKEQKQNRSPINYNQADCTSMAFLPDKSFDIVITNNVIQDVAEYHSAFKEFSRVLKPGGTYLHIENHPCFATPVWGWVKDEKGIKLYKKVDHYFKRGPFLMLWDARNGIESVYWHRTLGDIMNSIIENGFSIRRVIEPEPPEIWKTTHPNFMDSARIPDFIVIVCQKEK
jgi:ubiquinone/menaquinone biosynthesis C-methylase UbiE